MRVSAGILLYRRRRGDIEVLIAHPGGPFWAKRDKGAWSIPKGELHPGEDAEAAAIREFTEETGHELALTGLIDLGTVRQRSGKVVHGFGAEGNLDPGELRSNLIEIQWPPRSGRSITIPEIDQVRWVEPDEGRALLVPGQGTLVVRLVESFGFRS